MTVMKEEVYTQVPRQEARNATQGSSSREAGCGGGGSVAQSLYCGFQGEERARRVGKCEPVWIIWQALGSGAVPGCLVLGPG